MLRILVISIVAVAATSTLACAPSMPAPDAGPRIGYEALELPPSAATEAASLTLTQLAALSSSVSDASPISSRTATDRGYFSQSVSSQFEALESELDPAEVLPKELLQGPYHVVRSVSVEPGFLYRYVVDTYYGEVEVRGTGMLRKRVHEFDRLGKLRNAEVGPTEVYVISLANAATAPVETGLQMLRHPIRSTRRIPKGAWAMARGYVEMAGMNRTYLEDDYVQEMMGFGKAKREWAARLGVDPYSANPFVQRALDRNSWYALAGGMSARLPLIAVPGGASIALTVTNTSTDMHRELKDLAPEDLRVTARERLREGFGVEESLSDRFLEHPWYSPRRQATIIDSLSLLEQAENRAEFISLASGADEPLETFAFARIAMLFASYDEKVSPLEAFFSTRGLIMARSVEGDVVLPLYIDAGRWTASMAAAEAEVSRYLDEGRPVRTKRLLISGTLSEKARSELERRGWHITENLEQEWLAALDAKAFEPSEGDAERILPEI